MFLFCLACPPPSRWPSFEHSSSKMGSLDIDPPSSKMLLPPKPNSCIDTQKSILSPNFFSKSLQKFHISVTSLSFLLSCLRLDVRPRRSWASSVYTVCSFCYLCSWGCNLFLSLALMSNDSTPAIMKRKTCSRYAFSDTYTSASWKVFILVLQPQKHCSAFGIAKPKGIPFSSISCFWSVFWGCPQLGASWRVSLWVLCFLRKPSRLRVSCNVWKTAPLLTHTITA